TSTAAFAQAPADAADAAADAGDAIVVTARNRQENIQDVPIPISVLDGEKIAQQRVLTLADLTQRSPGLTATTPNARRTGVSLRGIGKTSGNDNMEAAVGVIVDDVFLGHVGMTYQDFTDLQQVEVLRGPQGTLLGKNTSLGVVKYTSKAPSFTPQGTAEIEGGLSAFAFKARASYSDAIIDDVLAFRVSAFINKQDGDIFNINTRTRWHEQDRKGGRLQLLFKPADNFSIKLNVDGTRSNENSNTKPFMIDPTYLANPTLGSGYTGRLQRGYFGGYTPILGSWDTIDMDHALPLVTWNWGGSLVADWDIGGFRITSISALREFHFDANNDSEQTHFTIARSGTLVDTEQLSQELRVNGNITSALDFQAGIYFFGIKTDTTGRSTFGKDAGAFYANNDQYRALAASPALLQASLNNVFQTSYQRPISTSQAVFAQFNWKPVDRLTLTAGIRYTREQKKSLFRKTTTYLDGTALVATGNTDADAIRTAQIGNAANANTAIIIGEPIRDDSIAWLVNPSFKVNDDLLIYASASGGGKSGAVSFGSNGQRLNVAPEKTTDYELGFKAQLLGRKLSINANLYYTIVRDYQNVTSVVDNTSDTGFSSRLGNIPGIHARGVEFDASVQPVEGLTISLGGAYNKATYSDWATATCPRSVPVATGVCNNTGKQLVGAPLWTINSGVNYEHELGSTGVGVHLFVNDVYRTSHNLEQLLSPYGWQKAYHITDAGLGFVHKDGDARTELSVVAKNLFDVQYTTSINDFSNSAPVGYDGIGARRYVGVVLRSQF
ncbi:MAG: TonB-dependent receptor, partial [Sphingobium sp.]